MGKVRLLLHSLFQDNGSQMNIESHRPYESQCILLHPCDESFVPNCNNNYFLRNVWEACLPTNIMRKVTLLIILIFGKPMLG